MESEKSCYNCRYFHQHYVMSKDKIRTLNCGHCSGRKINVKELSNFPFKDGCELWENNKAIIQEKREILTVMLKAMAKQIKHIELMLEENIRNSSE